MKGDLLILGVGNYLMGDEGVGVHFVRSLEPESWPAGVKLLDGGTAGFRLMEDLESYPNVIMVDATLDGRPAGTIRLIEPKFAADFPSAMSTHEIGLKDLVEGLVLLDKLPRIYLFVVSIDRVQPLSMQLSTPVQSILPELRERVRALALQLGVKASESEGQTVPVDALHP
ncbi:MAG: hydrogenase maturation protease [Cyclobacteriaceae bacterium]|nr:hydrogenase maturation protease [Cyclobacteriaceae bacterium]